MGYFSNSTEGHIYEHDYCNRCQHEDREKGCPVWNLHLLWNYDQNSDTIKELVLDLFIPRAENGFNEQCVMFWKRHTFTISPEVLENLRNQSKRGV